VETLEAEGKTLLFVAVDSAPPTGVLAAMDTARPEVARARQQ
jgi:cation transport ATPase